MKVTSSPKKSLFFCSNLSVKMLNSENAVVGRSWVTGSGLRATGSGSQVTILCLNGVKEVKSSPSHKRIYFELSLYWAIASKTTMVYCITKDRI